MQVHFIAIGGSAMHALAICLHKQGHIISGSDDEIYGRAREKLAANGLLPEAVGWFPERIHEDLDAIILGMHAKSDNPELIRARSLGIPVYSYPEYIGQMSVSQKRIAICGSHGKTTTTAMILHVLREMDLDCDYVLGAPLQGYEDMVRLSGAPWIVLEGDEYLSSPLDPRPKFLHYAPHVAVITGIAWDHINVFPTFEAYCRQFSLLIESLVPGASLVWNGEDEALARVVHASGRKDLHMVEYQTFPFDVQGGTFYALGQGGKYPLQVIGRHNLSNLSAALEVLTPLGISPDTALKELSHFEGAERRLQRIFHREGMTAYLDFAHAPSKCQASVRAIRELYPEKRVTAIYELHTYSSLQADFLPQYAHCLDEADEAIVFISAKTLEIKGRPLLPEHLIHAAFQREDIRVVTDPNVLEETIRRAFPATDVWLFMSSGHFGGLSPAQLLESLSQGE